MVTIFQKLDSQSDTYNGLAQGAMLPVLQP